VGTRRYSPASGAGSDNSAASHAPAGWLVWAAALWLLGFFAFFFSFTLPNSGIERLELARQAPFLLLENIDPSDTNAEASPRWANLSQRADLAITAAGVLAGAWGMGSLALRAVALCVGFRRAGDERRLALTWAERTVFTFGLGLSFLSLLTLACGLAGLLSREVFAGVLGGAFVLEVLLRIAKRPGSAAANAREDERDETPVERRPRRDRVILTYTQMVHVVCILAMVPFLLAIILGAMLPPVDFDVKAYHLVGPKEWFQAGRITFLSHNVYTSFPFLTEMLSLLGMVMRGDWFRGALAGQAVLAAFGPLTALAVYAAGTRWFGSTVGILAATIHLTTPWTYRISSIAYAEGGLTFYLFAALLAAMLAIERLSSRGREWRPMVLIAGLLAGSAMACKYPGLLQVVIPLGLAVCVAPVVRLSGEERRRDAIRAALLFTVGTCVTIGPWLVKNLIETGNPVYPLAYGVFGGRDLTPELAAKWSAGHSPDNHTLRDLAEKFIDVVAKSDWLSPLLFGLAPLALLPARRRALVSWLWSYVAFLFFGWWLFTHRIDRFWIPLIPVMALLAGIGALWRESRVWYIACAVAIAAAVTFNLAFITSSLVGYNAYLADLDQARAGSESTATGIAFLNENLPAGARVLAVGEAQVFDARFPIVYNSVFDESIFEQWLAEPRPDVPHAERSLRPAEEIRQKLKSEGITHVYVNWQEILRYRTTYRYTDFVTPQRFARLQEMGILGRPVTLAGREWDSLRDSEQREVERWAPELKTHANGEPALITFQVYPVLPE
jgi:4-amino-4-deoxy-L-arabinose transferase-like glycosyltransferase